jgi:hypothetical protein
MNVQVIQHDMPLARWRITGNQLLKMRQRILFGARGSPGWFNHLSADDSKMDEPGQGAMPNGLKFPSQHMPGLHRQVGMFALEGLHPGQLIQADGAFAFLGPLFRPGIHLTAFDDLFLSALIGTLGQPVAEPLRLQPPFLSSRAACLGESCLTMPRAFTSSAISRPVHWLMGRPALLGASQAKAAI